MNQLTLQRGSLCRSTGTNLQVFSVLMCIQGSMTAVLLPGGCVDTHLHPMQLEKCWKILEDQRWPEFPLKSWVPQGSISIPVAIPTSLRVRSCWPVVMRINNSSSCDRCDLDSPEVAVVLNFDGSSHGWVFQLLGRFLDKEKEGFICW